MRKIAVIGLGFGDEGKGMVTSSLVDRYLKDPEYAFGNGSDKILVVRYSGGHQAGHTVHVDGMSHVFANFGSGTLQGTPTYWSKACTVDPVGLSNELKILVDKMKGEMDNIHLYINEQCPITTPYDINHNQFISTNGHGTCGVGFGATIGREKNHVHLQFGDLFYPSVMDIKLNMIKNYYGTFTAELTEFREAVNAITSSMYYPSDIIEPVEEIPEEYYTIIYEGSQGLLLDKDIGFFPHVTRSNVGLKGLSKLKPVDEVYYVTRAYQTRHGNGPMTDERELDLDCIEFETNKKHEYQGKFRTGILDLDLLQYAIEHDRKYQGEFVRENLVITCMDQLKTFKTIQDGTVKVYKDAESFDEGIAKALNIDSVYLSWSTNSEINKV